ncbi:hypothetical protein O3G_MSEX000333 [Manduca sexta]|nr:hypothetical protein O3G_MSEX000333 [Manduca sexta]KAG6438924.1 hypothetical protein O3G_MSEX000333 [Manduca sexta]
MINSCPRCTLPKKNMEIGFIKTDCANLPKMESFMIANFFASNPDFCSAEFRNVETLLSSRQLYGDDANSYAHSNPKTSI